MDVQSVRDWVLIIAGILWGLVTLVVAVVLFTLIYISGRSLGAARSLVGEQGRPVLERLHAQLTTIRDRTSLLPGNVPVLTAEARPARARPGLRLPFRRRRRRLFILPR